MYESSFIDEYGSTHETSRSLESFVCDSCGFVIFMKYDDPERFVQPSQEEE